MTPTVDERLASVIRSLTEVILPHLPPDASLAQEQVQLAVGHLQILRVQLDDVPAFEREELDDTIAIAKALWTSVAGGVETTSAIATLKSAATGADGSDVRQQTTVINRAIDALVKAISLDGTANSRAIMTEIILEHERCRVLKDRKWFLPFGFDTIIA